MRGDLVEKTAADVCRELAARGASGILAIDGPGGPGRVVFADGRIIAAVSPTPRARLGDRLVGAGELDPDDLANALAAQQEKGESLPLGSLLVERGLVRRDAVRVFVQEQVLDALFEVIRWRYGAFTFTADDDARGHGVPLSLSVDDALVEVARRQHEWNELSQVIPDLDSVPSFRVGAASASAALEPDEFAVLASVDGVRSVRALAADLGYGEFEAARIVYGLSLLGIVDVRPPQDEIGAALEDALGLGDFELPNTAGAADVDADSDEGVDTSAADDVIAEAGPAPEEPDRSDEPAASAAPLTPDEPPTPEPRDETTRDAPTPASHLHVVADLHETPADDPEPQPAGSDDGQDGSSDEPDVWVSAGLEDEEPTTRASETLDAELDLEHDFSEAGDADAASEQPPPPPDRSDTPTEGRPDLDDRDDDADAAASAERSAARRSGLGRGLSAIIPEIIESTRRPSDDPTASSDQASRPQGPSPAEEPAASEHPMAPTTGPEPGEERPPSRPSPAGSTGSSLPTPTPEHDPPATGDRDEPDTPDPSTGQRGDDNDVSEFLRELSRLSVDGPSDSGAAKPPYRPPSSSGSSSSDADNAKKKRRGLFGRG